MMDGSIDRPKKQVEQVADDTDPDGLPLADAAFFAALETDALTAWPKATDWAVLVAGLRWAAEVGRRGGEAAVPSSRFLKSRIV
jgi:hypothetical protein